MIVALISAILILVAFNRRRLPALRDTVDAGANASALPVLSGQPGGFWGRRGRRAGVRDRA